MPSGDPKSSRFRQRQSPVGLTLTGFLIALSFVAMIIPLALFHAAQLAAALSLRVALGITAASVFVVIVLGLVLGMPPLMAGGMVGLFWLPLFALVLRERMLLRTPWVSLVALCLPVFLLVASIFLFPTSAEIEASLRTFSAVPNLDPSLKQLLDELQGAPLSEVTAFARLDPWARLAWFVFGDGVSWSLLTVGMGFANLVFLDLAFEQVDKLKAVARYSKRNPAVFPEGLVAGLESLSGSGRSRAESSMDVVAVRRISEEEGEGGGGFSRLLFRPVPRAGRVRMWGLEFELAFVRPSWNLRRFALPLWLVLGAVLVLGGILAFHGSIEGVVAAAAHTPGLAIPSFLALVLVTVVAVQGLVVALERLTPGFLLVLVVLLFLVSGFVGSSAFVALGALGLLGILDYAYGFRGHLAKRTKAV